MFPKHLEILPMLPPHFWILLLGPLCFSVITSSGQRPQLVFGQSCPLSGNSAQAGFDLRHGILAAFGEINRQQSLSHDLELISLDDQYTPALSVNNSQQLIFNQKVFALCGYYGTSTAVAVVPYAVNNSIPLIGTYSGSTLIREPFLPAIVNIRASYDEEAAAIVNYLVSERLIDNIAVLYQNDDFGKSGLASLTTVMQSLGLSIMAQATYERNTLNVEGAVEILFNANPEAIVLIAVYAPGSKFVNLYRQKPGFKSTTVFVAPSVIGPEAFMSMLSPPLNNIYISQVFPVPTDTSSSVVRRYLNSLNTLNSSLTPTYVSLEGYITGRFIANVIERIENNLTQAAFLDAVYKSSIFRINDVRLGPYFYSQAYNPFALPSEVLGCNQGVRQLFITDFNDTIGALGLASSPFQYYSTCKCNLKQILFPVVFAAVCSSSKNCDSFQRGIQVAFESTRVTRALTGLKLQLLSVTIPQGSTMNQIVSSVPWYDHIIGYIGNEGSINSNMEFIQQETKRGKVIFGSSSGDLSLRTPYNQYVVNVRASIVDEVYAISKRLLYDFNYKSICLITDGSIEGYQAHTIFSLQMMTNGLDSNDQFYIVTNYTSATQLLHDAYPSANPPQVIVLVGAYYLLRPIAQLLATKNVDRVFTSLNSINEIYDMNLGNPNRLWFSNPLPSFIDASVNDMAIAFDSDYKTQYPNEDSYYTDPKVYEGYMVGTFIATLISRITGTINGDAIVNQIISVRSFDVQGIKLGPYSNVACPGDDANEEVSGCNCNQGMRNVYLYNVAVANNSYFYPTNEYIFPFDTCGVNTDADYLRWDDLSNGVNMALVSVIFVMAGFTFLAILYTFRYFNHPVIVAASPIFMILSLIGILIGYFAIIPFIGEPTNTKCLLQPWIAGLAWITVLGNLNAKNYRIYRIFASGNKRDAGKLNNAELLKISFGFILIELFLLMLWSVVEAPHTSIDPIQKWKYCEGNNGLRIALIVYNVIVVLITTILSVKTRNAYEKFSDAKVLGLTSYNLFFMGVILFGLILQSGFNQRFLLTCCMILLLNTPTLFFIFGVKVYYILAEVKLSSTKPRDSSLVTSKKVGGSLQVSNIPVYSITGREPHFPSQSDAHNQSQTPRDHQAPNPDNITPLPTSANHSAIKE